MKGRALRGLLRLMVCLLAGSFGVAHAQTTAPVSSSAASAAIPRLVQFSRTLKGVNGRPITGVVGVTFSIYADQEGGAPLWMETQNVTADADGKYTVFLGAASNGIPDFVFVSGQGRWLGVQAGLEPEMPRVLLVSVPYALKAGDANTLGGLPPSAFLLAGPVVPLTVPAATGNAGPSSPTPATTSDVTTTGGTTDYLPLWTGASTVLNSVLFQSGTEIGINNKAPAATLDVTGGGIFRGSLRLASTGTATSSVGYNSQPFQLAASSFNSSSKAAVAQEFEWQAEPTGNDTTSPSGSLHLLFGSGTSTPTETGLSISKGGIFSFASGQTFPGTGAGTITGVTAGTGLSGGGTSGKVTLSLASKSCVAGDAITALPLTCSPFATLGANTFTGNQIIASGNVGIGTATPGPNMVGGLTINGTAPPCFRRSTTVHTPLP
jgi:trimeric autotransporter adhesin